MKKLRVAAQAVAICGVIAFMAWMKSRGITVVNSVLPSRTHRNFSDGPPQNYPVTVAGVVLLRCGCATAAWTLELVTAAAYLV